MLLTTLALASCATPPGQLTEEDFVWEQREIVASWTEVHRRLFAGFRQCGPETGGIIFVTLVGVPNCFADPERRTVLCDVYLSGQARSVVGRIHVAALDASHTELSVGARTWFASHDQTRVLWLGFANGEIPCGR